MPDESSAESPVDRTNGVPDSPSLAAYQDGLRRFQVRDLGRRHPPERRWQLRDGNIAVLISGWVEVYAVRRLLAAQHAAELLGCLDRLETRMEAAPGDRVWLARLQAAAAGQ